jgi:copper(I)-binding protein
MIHFISRAVSALTVFLFLVSSVFSQTSMMKDTMPMGQLVIVGDLEIWGAFTRAMPPAAFTGGGFVTIKNTGAEDDRLVSASSVVSAHVETHTMRMDGDVMKMHSQPEGFVVPAGGVLELKPGGKHLMFIGVEKPFVEGTDISVTLVFEHAGMVEVMLHAIPIGALAMEHGGMEHGGMNHSAMEHETMNLDTTSN